MTKTSLDPAATLVPLPQRALIAITGGEAASFLNNLLTANIEALPVGHATLAALLTPQGKIIADMLVANASDEEPLYFLDVSAGQSDDLAERLERFKLRSAVEIARLPADVAVFAALDAPALAGEAFYTFADPRSETLGQRLYGPAQGIEEACADFARAGAEMLAGRRIALGVPECGTDYWPMTAYPHEVNMEQIGGVDFKKGCYVGQEIVSRMEHRGTARTRMLIATMLNGFGIEPAAEVRAQDKVLGALGVSVGDRALAMVRLDRVEEALAAGIPIKGGGVALRLSKPGYARFTIDLHE